MPKIDIHRPHALSLEEARGVVDQVAARLSDKFGVQGQWRDDVWRFARSGVKGAIAVTEADIRVTAELGLMLSPLKGMVEEEIQRKLAEHFG